MRIAVIGGAGFIGTALARELLDLGHEPCVLDLPARLERAGSWLAGVETAPLHFPDLSGLGSSLRGAEALAHLACTTDPSRSMDSMLYDAETNIAPSLAVFEAAVEHGIGRIVFSSSGGTVYGRPQTLPLDEAHPTRPISAYGVTKLAVENYLALFAVSRGICGISLRIANPYGPFQLRGAKVGVIARYVAELHAGRPLEVWGDGTVVRDYIHIDDVARATATALITDDLPSGSYNIGSGTGASINRIIKLVFDVAGRRVPVLYTAARPYDVPAVVLDSRCFQAATGWAPEIGLDDGTAAMWSSALGQSAPGVMGCCERR